MPIERFSFRAPHRVGVSVPTVRERHAELILTIREAVHDCLAASQHGLDWNGLGGLHVPKQSLPLREKPSDYFRRQCWISADPDERAVAHVIEYVGADRLFWAPDYPHGDHPSTYIDDIAELTSMLPEASRGVLGDNARACYRWSRHRHAVSIQASFESSEIVRLEHDLEHPFPFCEEARDPRSERPRLIERRDDLDHASTPWSAVRRSNASRGIGWKLLERHRELVAVDRHRVNAQWSVAVTPN